MKKVKLKQVLKNYKKKHMIQNDKSYRQVTISQTGDVSFRGEKHGTKIGRKRQFLIDLKNHPNTLIFIRQGVMKGGIGICPPEVDGCVVTENMPMFDIVGINPDYLLNFIKSPLFKEDVSKLVPIGTAQKALHENKLLEIEIPYLSEEKQKGMVKKIQSIEKEVKQLEGKSSYDKNLLQKLRQSILQEAFSKENSNLVKLGSLINFEPGKKIEGKKYSYLEARYLRGKKEPKILDKGNFVVQGELIILMDGENSGEVFELNESGYLGSTFKILRYSKEVNRKYLQYFLMLNKDRYKNSKKGIAIPHLDKKLVRDTLLPLPPLAEQKRIVEKVDSLMGLCDELELRIKENKGSSERLMGAVLGEVFENEI